MPDDMHNDELATVISFQQTPASLIETHKFEVLQHVIQEMRWILQYGAEVEVVEPVELREDIIFEIEKLKSLYF